LEIEKSKQKALLMQDHIHKEYIIMFIENRIKFGNEKALVC
jgi:hypothetical protein